MYIEAPEKNDIGLIAWYVIKIVFLIKMPSYWK